MVSGGELSQFQMINDDCLKVLPTLKDKSIDLVLTDPPYGITACKWDSVIPFSLMWLNLKRIIKDNGCIALFGTEPFSSYLRTSNIKWFKYDWYWKKSRFSNQLQAKKQPLRIIELISIFYKKNKYYPQNLIQFNKITKQGKKISDIVSGGTRKTQYYQEFTNYPRNVLEFKSLSNNIHPTQKPVALLEYLIKTYTKENDTVLDFTMGSGSTGVACKNLSRDFIGIELDKDYYKIAKQRVGVLN